MSIGLLVLTGHANEFLCPLSGAGRVRGHSELLPVHTFGDICIGTIIVK